jgi:hypothetical protein
VPRIKPPKSFLLIIVDQDMRVFNLVGPVSNDSDWNHRVSEARKKGRNIRIDDSPHMASTRDEIVAETRKRLNCEYAEVSLV